MGLGKLGDDNTADGGYNCNGPQIYGVKQCVTNFTEADLTEDPAGSFQGLDEWYFQEIANAAADEDPDVVVFVGDYLYRQGPCPEGAVNSANNKVKECSGVNAYSHMNETIEDDKLMNFMPGLYGDNWWGWWADWVSLSCILFYFITDGHPLIYRIVSSAFHSMRHLVFPCDESSQNGAYHPRPRKP